MIPLYPKNLKGIWNNAPAEKKAQLRASGESQLADRWAKTEIILKPFVFQNGSVDGCRL
jgi:hypothetical protein